MNRGEARELLSDILNFNDGQTDQDFTVAQLNRSLSRAYRREVVRAAQEGVREYFLAVQEMTWPASQEELELPKSLGNKYLIRLEDITGGQEPGSNLQFSQSGHMGSIRWMNANTLRWRTSGPPSARTLRVFYFASPPDMQEDWDELDYIPEAWQPLVVWRAAIELRRMADEMAPASWLEEQQELRMGFWKHVSRGRPVDNVPWAIPGDTTGLEGLSYT